MHLYGLIIGVALIIGINFFLKNNQTVTKDKEAIFLSGTILSAIIGARLYHVFDYWQFYSQNLLLILKTWNGGLGIFGGLFGGLAFIYLFSILNKLNFLKIIDQITPILPLCQAIGRLGNWINRENPNWWIEALADLVLFFLIFKYPKNPTAKYLIGYGLIRLLTDFYRTDLWIINSVKISQIIGLVFVILGVNLIYRERIKISKNHR